MLVTAYDSITNTSTRNLTMFIRNKLQIRRFFKRISESNISAILFQRPVVHKILDFKTSFKKSVASQKKYH